MKACSDDSSKGHHCLGHEANMAPGGYEIAMLAAGGALTALTSIMEGKVSARHKPMRVSKTRISRMSFLSCSPW